eukprot:4412710-Alexandrium_andersonii.AAC.1
MGQPRLRPGQTPRLCPKRGKGPSPGPIAHGRPRGLCHHANIGQPGHAQAAPGPVWKHPEQRLHPQRPHECWSA